MANIGLDPAQNDYRVPVIDTAATLWPLRSRSATPWPVWRQLRMGGVSSLSTSLCPCRNRYVAFVPETLVKSCDLGNRGQPAESVSRMPPSATPSRMGQGQLAAVQTLMAHGRQVDPASPRQRCPGPIAASALRAPNACSPPARDGDFRHQLKPVCRASSGVRQDGEGKLRRIRLSTIKAGLPRRSPRAAGRACGPASARRSLAPLVSCEARQSFFCLGWWDGEPGSRTT